MENKGVIDELENNPAFNPQKAVGNHPMTVGGTVDKAAAKAQKYLHLAAHPRTSIKHKAEKKLATSDQPFTSREADQTLLDAHKELSDAEDGSDDEDVEDTDRLKRRIHDLEEHRESLRIAWTSSRFIHRVRVVPDRQLKFPKLAEYPRVDEDGRVVGTDWLRWYGHFLLYVYQDVTTRYMDEFEEPQYDRDILMRHLERLIIASAPWQAWWMQMREVQRWEDPVKTARWLTLFLFLWYINQVFTFIWFYVIYITLKYRYTEQSRDAMRESHERAAKRSATAFNIGEIIHRHGRGNWLEGLLDEMGPTLQMQLADTADYLEILDNFYRWKNPRKTVESLLFWVAAVIYTGVLPLNYNFRVVSLTGIVIFFGSRPVGSRFPKYRHLVSPLRLMFWDVPTNAEWTFQYLQEKARETRMNMLNNALERREAEGAVPHASSTPIDLASVRNARPDTHARYDRDDGSDEYESASSSLSASNLLESTDIISFKGTYNGTRGRLIIQSDGLRFVRTLASKQLWYRPFSDLLEMRKIDGQHMARLKNKSSLEFEYFDGTVEHIDNIRQRDEAFNTVIGFSALRWQQLQPLEKEPGHQMGSGTILQTEKDKKQQQERASKF